jgi:hypothetical protein
MSENYVLLRTTRRGSLRIIKMEFLEGSKDEELGGQQGCTFFVDDKSGEPLRTQIIE